MAGVGLPRSKSCRETKWHTETYSWGISPICNIRVKWLICSLGKLEWNSNNEVLKTTTHQNGRDNCRQARTTANQDTDMLNRIQPKRRQTKSATMIFLYGFTGCCSTKRVSLRLIQNEEVNWMNTIYYTLRSYETARCGYVWVSSKTSSFHVNYLMIETPYRTHRA